jgi:hypothetical protein
MIWLVLGIFGIPFAVLGLLTGIYEVVHRIKRKQAKKVKPVVWMRREPPHHLRIVRTSSMVYDWEREIPELKG